MAEAHLRRVIVHVHLFKNAGTSVDRLLARSFNEQFYPDLFQETPEEAASADTAIGAFLDEHSDALAISSHNLSFPLSASWSLVPYPIVFLRNPFVRLRSAYAFERKQPDSSTAGRAIAADATSFADYVSARLDRTGDFFCRDFQARRLAGRGVSDLRAIERVARSRVDALPVVGVVEMFEQSIALYRSWLQPEFPQFTAAAVWANAQDKRGLTEAEAEDEVRDELGDELFDRLLAENQIDVALHRRAKHLLSDRAGRPKVNSVGAGS